MPQAIPYALAIALEYGASYWVIAALAVAAIASNAHQRRKASRQARDAFNSSLKDRLVMTATADGPRSRIYGECRNVDGVLFKGTHGANSQFYTLVVAFAGHECESIEKVYFNDQELELSSDGAGGWWVETEPYMRHPVLSDTATMTLTGGGATVTLPHTPDAASLNAVSTDGTGSGAATWGPGDFTVVGNVVTIPVVDPLVLIPPVLAYQYVADVPKARIWKYLGTDSQDIGADLLQSRFPTLINTAGHDDRFAGICLVVVELEFDQDAFPIGLPNITGLVRGAKVYDPRTDTTAWTQNPSLIARDWSLYERGGACLAAEVPDAMVEAAANACDQETDFETPDGTETRPLYQCDIVCRLDAPPDSHLAEIVESMAGKYGWAGGQLRWVAGVYRAPVAHITEDWVTDAESITIVPQPARADVVNVYRPSIAHADMAVDGTTGQTAAYTQVSLPELRNESYIAEDGEELTREIVLGGVQHNAHAQHICGVLMRDAHEGLVINLPCNMRAWPQELFDTVTLTLSKFGFDEKEFELLGWRFSAEKCVGLTLKETSAAIFDPDAEMNVPTNSANSTLVLPWVVPEITGFAVEDAPEDGTQQSRALVSWDAVVEENVRNGGQVEVQYRVVTSTYSEDDWRSWAEVGSSVSTIVPNLNADEFYIFRARAVNALRVRGLWCTQLLYRPSVPLVDTDQLAVGSVTEVIQGDTDTTIYYGGYGLTYPGQLSVTPTHDCRLIITMSGSLRAPNTTGSAQFIKLIYTPYVNYAGAGPGGSIARNVANGETWENFVTCNATVDADAGTEYVIGLRYSDHTSATLTSQLTNTSIRVEVIKR